MSAPVDDFDLDIRLGSIELTEFGGSVAGAGATGASNCQTECRSACTTGCRASECVCTRTQ
ncbi:hypothetical protein [Actinocrispum sp. NPDC049592]|uniref:hypothetical protein n=1 Tax=Actinocrispum sp. NPDC049592 TaxID=3154835 RepID=UPI00343EFF3F